MKPLVSLFFILFLSSSLNACCGCAIVIKTMSVLKNTVSGLTESMDKSLSDAFDVGVYSDSNVSLQEMLKREEELRKSIIALSEIGTCYEEIGFSLEQLINVESVSKTIKIMNEAENTSQKKDISR